MDVEKILKNKRTVLMLMPSGDYNKNIISTIKSLSKKNVCYVTLNKTYASLTELFSKNKVNLDNVVFIDAISATIKKVPSQTHGCYYVSSPSALTELSLVISKFLKHNFDYLIFDSLSNLTIYTKKAPVAKFLSNLVNKIDQSTTNAVFYALNTNEQKELIEECSMFVDEVVKTKK
jgi:poly-D-alanine transfer protein DltD